MSTGREPRREENKEVQPEVPSLDAWVVIPCPNHGMDHVTRDPSGPFQRHLKEKESSG